MTLIVKKLQIGVKSENHKEAHEDKVAYWQLALYGCDIFVHFETLWQEEDPKCTEKSLYHASLF